VADIDLAPNHKHGLLVHSPLLLSPVAVGFGDSLPHGLDLAQIGGVVVGPVSASGRGYSGTISLVELDGGVLASHSSFSRSARRAVERFAATWARLNCPVIVQLVDAVPADLVKAAQCVVQAPAVAAVEWKLPRAITAAQVGEGVRALQQNIEAPIWVKPSLENAVNLAEQAVAAGAVGVVVGQPLQGAVLVDDPVTGAANRLNGDLYGPLTFAPMLRALFDVANAQLGCALIACGGIYRQEHIRQSLAAGAHAVQLDAVLWREGRVGDWRLEIGDWRLVFVRDDNPQSPIS
jgi:dihydroorotate dehydrogenase (NAD+) catalytic subunit